MAGTKASPWCHIEIPASDVARARRFYGNVFGWTFHDVPEMNYTIYQTVPDGLGGGLWNPAPGIPRQIVCYLLVDDIEESVAAVKKNGGRLVNPKMEVPGMGWFALVADPDGNVIGVWRSKRPPAPAKKPRTARRPKPAAKRKPAGRKKPAGKKRR